MGRYRKGCDESLSVDAQVDDDLQIPGAHDEEREVQTRRLGGGLEWWRAPGEKIPLAALAQGCAEHSYLVT